MTYQYTPQKPGGGVYFIPDDVNADLLSEELINNDPPVPKRHPGKGRPVMRVLDDVSQQDYVTVEIEPGEEGTVDAVLQAHNPALPSSQEQRRVRLQALLDEALLQARTDPKLKSIFDKEYSEIEAFVATTFPNPDFTAPQRTVIEILSKLAWINTVSTRLEEMDEQRESA